MKGIDVFDMILVNARRKKLDPQKYEASSSHLKTHRFIFGKFVKICHELDYSEGEDEPFIDEFGNVIDDPESQDAIAAKAKELLSSPK